jgi:hypothetical protein
MPRYVVLHHDCPTGSHFDLMLEWDGVLKTWSLARPPETDRPMDCVSLPDHRQAYLDYEGPVSDNRGSVACWDRGDYEIDEQTGTHWSVKIRGDRLAGKLTLTQQSSDVSHWTLLYLTTGDSP